MSTADGSDWVLPRLGLWTSTLDAAPVTEAQELVGAIGIATSGAGTR